MNEAALDLPDGAIDRSLTSVTLSTPSGAKAAFIVERHEIAPERTLREACRSYTRDLEMRVRRLSRVFERDGSVAGVPALEIGVCWYGDDGAAMYTRQAHIRLEALWMVLAIQGPRDARAELDALFEPILASIRLRG